MKAQASPANVAALAMRPMAISQNCPSGDVKRFARPSATATAGTPQRERYGVNFKGECHRIYAQASHRARYDYQEGVCQHYPYGVPQYDFHAENRQHDQVQPEVRRGFGHRDIGRQFVPVRHLQVKFWNLPARDDYKHRCDKKPAHAR